MSKEMKIGDGSLVTVDAEVFGYLSNFTWSANGNGYAFRREYLGGRKYKKIYMHREIVKAVKGEYVDHINLDKSDNRKCNLRICTNSENARNQPGRTGTSKYKGVYFDRKTNRYVAQITHNYKCIKLGGYYLEKDAARAYNDAAKELFGDFARLNMLPEEAKH